jgi:hypothetical protein
MPGLFRLSFLRRFIYQISRQFVLKLMLLLIWSGLLGWGFSQAALPQQPPAQPPEKAPVITPTQPEDAVPERYQLGQQLYLENCASCHVGLPPAVMPSQTWADLLQDSQHYGVQVTPLLEPSLQIVWRYVSNYSRPILKNEIVPYRLQQSRYFKALHPKVEFASPPTVNSCVTCHPAAAQFNYRSLTPEWDNAP